MFSTRVWNRSARETASGETHTYTHRQPPHIASSLIYQHRGACKCFTYTTMAVPIFAEGMLFTRILFIQTHSRKHAHTHTHTRRGACYQFSFSLRILLAFLRLCVCVSCVHFCVCWFVLLLPAKRKWVKRRHRKKKWNEQSTIIPFCWWNG